MEHKIVAAKDGSEVAFQEVTLDQDYEVRDLQVVERDGRMNRLLQT